MWTKGQVQRAYDDKVQQVAKQRAIRDDLTQRRLEARKAGQLFTAEELEWKERDADHLLTLYTGYRDAFACVLERKG